MIDTTVDNVKELRKIINSEFHEWYTDALRITNDVGCEISIARRQTHRANSVSKVEQLKTTII